MAELLERERDQEVRGKSGPFKNSEELRRALGVEKEDFEKIRYRLEYSN